VLAIWQLIHLSGWKKLIFPAPGPTLGAAPSIANGLITGIDYTPPLLLRAGQVMGLRRSGPAGVIATPRPGTGATLAKSACG
jgi:hypothetical protein